MANTEMPMQGWGISQGSLMQGTMRIRAVPVQKMVIFLCQARCCRNRGGHQQVYQWPGWPGASRFWQTAYIAKQAASSCRHKWQQYVAYCSFGRRLSSQNGWGTAEEVHAFWALIVQARSGIQVNKYYIHVYTMHVCRWAMYIHCTYMLYTWPWYCEVVEVECGQGAKFGWWCARNMVQFGLHSVHTLCTHCAQSVHKGQVCTLCYKSAQ